jgi:predicted nuclease with TOPRIM domain
MVPDGPQTEEIQNWLSVLQALELSREKSEMLTRENFETRLTLEDQIKKNQQLQENIEKLLNRNASLKENNASLKEAIERLKTLNLQVEKKRKSAK